MPQTVRNYTDDNEDIKVHSAGAKQTNTTA